MTGPANAPGAPTRNRPDAVAKLAIPDMAAGRPRTYAAAVVLVVLGLCVGAIGVNVAVNPRAEFPVQGLRPLVIDRVHDAILGYEARQEPAQDLVLGTSRAGNLHGLPGRENVTFNFYIAGSPPQDWLDLYDYVKRTEGPPVNLVLVVDQVAFTDVFAPRVPASADAGTVLGTPPSVGDRFALALRTLSASYVRDTLHSLELRTVTGYPPPNLGEPRPEFARPHLLEEYRNGTFDPAELEPAVDRQFVRAFGPEHAFVPANVDALRALLDEALADGVAVWAIVPPYQPVTLVDLEARFPTFPEQAGQVREFLVTFCGRIHVADATHVEDVGVDPKEFYDQSHLTVAGSRQLVEGVVAGRADACPADA
jgi:hypothetical protein